MGTLGLSGDAALRVLAALLHLADVRFQPFTQSGEATEGATVTEETTPSLEHAAQLLETPPAQLRTVLTQRSVQAGGGRRTAYTVPLSCEAAALARDALAKRLYGGLFDRTVERINVALSSDGAGASTGGVSGPGNGGDADASSSCRSIGLLDVFGFEIFSRNGFEQLMVNLANERLQRFFLDAIFRREAAEYEAEALPWVPLVDVPDNGPCILAIEARPFGVLPLLDEQCRLGDRGTDAALCQLLNEKNPACATAAQRAQATQRGRMAFRPEEIFTIDHFVDSVTYTAAEFLERNRDSFAGDLSRAIAASSSDYVRSLLPAESVQTTADVSSKGSGRSFQTVAGSFTASLATLLDELNLTDAGFVRCIKPNEQLRPKSFTSALVLQQLRTCGMVQAVAMMMAMYGARIPYEDIAKGWGVGGEEGGGGEGEGGGGSGEGGRGEGKGGGGGGGGEGGGGGACFNASGSFLAEGMRALPPRELVTALCLASEVPTCEYALGVSKVFFRAGQAVGLSALCKAPGSRAVGMTRSVLLQWKLGPHLRELRVARMVGAWLGRARIATGGQAAAAAARASYVQEATPGRVLASSSSSSSTTTTAAVAEHPGPSNESCDGVEAAYVTVLARRYRAVRREYAVARVRARAATRMQKIQRRRVAVARHRQVTSAVPRLQRAWRRKSLWEARKAAARRVQARTRGRHAQLGYQRRRQAAIRVEATVRGAAGRRRYQQAKAEYVAYASPYASAVQAWWRGTDDRRAFRAAQASTLLIQSSWRMSRAQKYHRRLLRAVVFLKQGGTLSKYRQKKGSLMGGALGGGAASERHDRYVRLSPDLKALVWFPPGHPYQQCLASEEARAVLAVRSRHAKGAADDDARGGGGGGGGGGGDGEGGGGDEGGAAGASPKRSGGGGGSASKGGGFSGGFSGGGSKRGTSSLATSSAEALKDKDVHEMPMSAVSAVTDGAKTR